MYCIGILCHRYVRKYATGVHINISIQSPASRACHILGSRILSSDLPSPSTPPNPPIAYIQQASVSRTPSLRLETTAANENINNIGFFKAKIANPSAATLGISVTTVTVIFYPYRDILKNYKGFVSCSKLA